MEPTNLIPKFTPVPLTVTDELREILRQSENHSVPFRSLSVDAFHEGALIREALAQYFQPDYCDERVKWNDEGEEIGKESKDTVLFEMLSSVVPQGLQKSYAKWREDTDRWTFPVRVKILIDYPLQEPWVAEVTIPADRFGSVFAIAHDMYCHIYKLDDAEWESEGHEDEAPRGAPMLMNRAAGKHVWGHDMSDLVFEGLNFTPNPEWPTVSKKKMKMIKVESLEEMAEIVKDEEKRKKLSDEQTPEIVGAPAPLDYKIHAEEAPFLGWVTFAIGS